MRQLTASKAPLLEHCAHWLRDSSEWAESTSGPPARIGSAVGFLAEQWADGKAVIPEKAWAKFELDHNVEYVGKASDGWNHLSGWLESSGIDGAKTEWAFGWNWKTGDAKALGKLESARAYPKLSSDWVVGTIDLYWNGHLRDFKYTRHVHVYERQIATLSMMVAETLPLEDTGIVHIDQAAGITEHVEPFDAFAGIGTKDWLRRRLSVVDSEGPKRGAWCYQRYCPHKAHCSEWKKE